MNETLEATMDAFFARMLEAAGRDAWPVLTSQEENP
jgi:hypothetical protein